MRQRVADCTRCGGPTYWDDAYDAILCEREDLWLDEPCGDPHCYWCPGRPARPSQSLDTSVLENDVTGGQAGSPARVLPGGQVARALANTPIPVVIAVTIGLVISLVNAVAAPSDGRLVALIDGLLATILVGLATTIVAWLVASYRRVRAHE